MAELSVNKPFISTVIILHIQYLKTSDLPYRAPVESFIIELSKKLEVIYVYVSHKINYGCVTCF